MNLPIEAPAGEPPAVLPLEFRLLARPWLDSCAEPEGRGDDGAAVAPGAAEEQAHRIDTAVDLAWQEGFNRGELAGAERAKTELEAELASGLDRERACIADALQDFADARARYFANVEREVVHLALAIAARVLHREVQMDPTLLAVAVRVSLDSVANSTGVVLRVPECDVTAWAQIFVDREADARPNVIGERSMPRGACLLEAESGKVDLGVHAQLQEIERGFFDLLAHRAAS